MKKEIDIITVYNKQELLDGLVDSINKNIENFFILCYISGNRMATKLLADCANGIMLIM